MAVAAGIMVPHPPLIVPDVGRGQEILIKDTIKAYQEAAGMAAELKPDTIVVISPHAVMYADYFHVSPGKEARGDFGRCMAPQIGVEAGYDEAFVRELDRLCGDDGFPMGTEGEREKELDHGTLVPLYFINQHYRDYKLVRIGGSGLSFADHYRAGRYIARAAENLGRSVFIVASGDLSHKLRGDGPYGYSVQGPEYDERIMDVMGKAEFGELLAFPEDFCEKAGECGHRSFAMMAGAMDKKAVMPRRLTYEGPFGVGYGICTFRVTGDDGRRGFLELYESCQREACKKRQMEEDDYVSLARRSLEYYVHEGRMIPFGRAEEGLPEEMLQTRAGVFVSVRKGGALRGCIGTIEPVCRNIAEEIIQNAVSAGIHDPRFPSVRREELSFLEYSVDVLGETEQIQGEDQLDPLRYGVIVTKGRKRGLLLPNLEGVDTVREQLSIARQKAGIGEDETDVQLERFEVIRHGAKS